MEDSQIIELYWQKNADAISETSSKYGSYCFTIADHILHGPEVSEECVNDTWLHAWNAMPPQRPNVLRMFLMDSEQQEVVPVTITNIELTNTGLIFRYDYADGALTIDFHINVVLDTGESIADGGSSGTLLEDGKTLNCSYQWLVPVDLDAVASIQIGDTTLIVP